MEETASAQLAATTDDGVTDDGVTDDGVTDDGATDDGATDDGATNDGVADDECPDEADEVDDEEEIPDWLQDLLQPETSCERFRRVPDMFGD